MKVNNPLSLVMAVLNLVAAAWEVWHNKDYRMGGLFACYAVASAILGVKL